jgi:AcrR family transcriptional regulator
MSDHPRDRILDTTRALLNRQDDDASPVTIGQVATAAHVSRATVYRYFPDRTALMLAAGATNCGEHPVEPRARIIEAALAVFAERGLHAATLAEIASRAGLTLSGLHWHFKNKDELVAAVAESLPILPTMMQEALRAEVGDVDLESQLTHIAMVGLKMMAQRRSALRLIIFEAGIHPDVAQFGRTHTIGRLLPMLASIFEVHEHHGALRPGSARVRAQAFLGMLLALALLRPSFDDLLEPDDEATVREYVQIVLRGVLAVPQGA